MTTPDLTSPSVAGLPRVIRILGKKFRIRIIEEDKEEDDEGSMELHKQEIAIRPREAIEQVQDTSLHEIIHAVEESLFLRMSETQVHKLATGLLAVFKDNPEYAKWLMQDS